MSFQFINNSISFKKRIYPFQPCSTLRFPPKCDELQSGNKLIIVKIFRFVDLLIIKICTCNEKPFNFSGIHLALSPPHARTPPIKRTQTRKNSFVFGFRFRIFAFVFCGKPNGNDFVLIFFIKNFS